MGPSAFPFGGSVEVAADLAIIAARTVEEGCVGETLAAILAAEQLEKASDTAVREALAMIAADEARHAELAWRVVAWAIEAGGDRVRAAVAAAFEAAFTKLGANATAGGARVTEAELRGASEILLGAATREVQPVSSLDGKLVGSGKPGPVWRKLHDAYQAYKRELAGTPW
jgi:hypothetical protein